MPVTLSLVLVCCRCSGRCRTAPGGWRRPCPARTAAPPGRRRCRGARRTRPRVDARVGDGLQRVVDDDAAVHSAGRRLRPAACWGGCRRPSPPGRPGSRAVLEAAAHGAHAWPSSSPSRPASAPIGSAGRAGFERRCSMLAGHLVELALHQPGHQVHHVTCMPRFIRPLAASRPSRPPPMTTACLVRLAGLDHGLRCRRCRGRRSRRPGPCRAPAG
jgi:hypothetical protein